MKLVDDLLSQNSDKLQVVALGVILYMFREQFMMPAMLLAALWYGYGYVEKSVQRRWAAAAAEGHSAVPRSRFWRISTVYLSKARLIFLLKCLFRSLIKSTSAPGTSVLRRENLRC